MLSYTLNLKEKESFFIPWKFGSVRDLDEYTETYIS